MTEVIAGPEGGVTVGAVEGIHVQGIDNTKERSFDTMEVVLDEDVSTKEAAKALGIRGGDIVCFDPRFTLTDSGYIKSRFLHDTLWERSYPWEA